MPADKLLSSLSYFSVFFAPFLFPIIVWIVASGKVRHHAGKALWTHLVPYLCIFIGLGASAMAWDSTVAFIIIAIFAVIGLYYFILNFVRGIKVLLED